MRSSYNFLNKLIQAKSVFIKSITRSFMLNTMMHNKNKSFTNISIFFWCNSPRIWCMLSWSQERDQNISNFFLYSIVVFNMMKLLVIIQVKDWLKLWLKSRLEAYHDLIYLSTTFIMRFFFLTEMRLHISKCNIKEQ